MQKIKEETAVLITAAAILSLYALSLLSPAAAAILLFLLPGYALTLALFPKKRIGQVERLSLGAALSISLFVEGSHGEALKKTVLKSIYAIFILLIPAIVSLYLFGDFVLGFVGKDYSMSGFELLRVMAVASVFVAVNNIFSSIKRVQKEVRQLLLLNGATSVLLLALSYVFMLNFGLIGAGYA
jgi:Na+-driven multidrug efflux pump